MCTVAAVGERADELESDSETVEKRQNANNVHKDRPPATEYRMEKITLFVQQHIRLDPTGVCNNKVFNWQTRKKDLSLVLKLLELLKKPWGK
jgi:hypothetical protein